MSGVDNWPELPLAEWDATRATLHMYCQVVGKIRLALAPAEPEWAHTPFYLTSRGFTTSPIPYRERTFQIDFDFIAHKVDIVVSDGESHSIALIDGRSVAAFYKEIMQALASFAIDVKIWPVAVEVPDPVNLSEDLQNKTYVAEHANRFFRTLVPIDATFKEHRAPYRRRHTLVQFFWGTFDLAYARFSGRPATPPSKDVIMREAMDAEEICVGFWAGDKRFPEAAFWAYAFPKPDGLERQTIAPAASFWNADMGLFMLRYEDVRKSKSPHDMIREFLTSTYDVCAAFSKWDEV